MLNCRGVETISLRRSFIDHS